MSFFHCVTGECLDKNKWIANGDGVHWLTGDTSFVCWGVWIKLKVGKQGDSIRFFEA